MKRQQSSSKRAGGVLVEFALVSFALYLLLAAIIDLGRVVMAGQLLQSAADQMARELAVAPLPATMTFEQALEDPYVKQRIYDPSKLVVILTPGLDVDDLFATFPVVNQMLRPLMVWDVLDDGREVLRYPGAVVRKDDQLTVLIPRIGVTGTATTVIGWVRVVEEVLAEPDAVPPQSHFPINAPQAAFRGNVILRMNYPFQAATMSAFNPEVGSGLPFESSIDAPTTVTAPGAGFPGYSLEPETKGPTPVRGPGGLGYHFAFLDGDGNPKRVLPFRKLISVRSFHRRENYGG